MGKIELFRKVYCTEVGTNPEHRYPKEPEIGFATQCDTDRGKSLYRGNGKWSDDFKPWIKVDVNYWYMPITIDKDRLKEVIDE